MAIGVELWRREAALAWPLAQATAAATIAWLIAQHIVDHHQPFFAPIAAVVALNTATGERGTNAFRLLLGVIIGIVIGEMTILMLGSHYWTLALATFASMSIARHSGGARVIIAQAAASAILTVAIARGEAGTQRLGDALIGGGVALMFSQVFFSPEPVRLIRRAAAATLREISRLLELTARALDEGVATDPSPEPILDSVRRLHDLLGELRQRVSAARRVVRHSVYWRSHSADVAREAERVRHLELFGGSILMFVRVILNSDATVRRAYVAATGELADAAESLAVGDSDRTSRQRVATRALRILRMAGASTSTETSESAARTIAHLLAADLLGYLGVELTDGADDGAVPIE